MTFADRTDAGRRLADRLMGRSEEGLVVLGLPRGGVVVAAEIARALGAPLDLAVAKKIGHPQNPEAAIGAVSEDGAVFVEPLMEDRVDPKWLEGATAARLREARALRLRLTGKTEIPDLQGRPVLIVDDGIATGQTMFAAVESARRRGARRIVVAVPVGPPGTLARLRERVDEAVALAEPEDLYAVGVYYADFTQVNEETVAKLLADR